jgi:DNA-binding NarL/FixJ family response regulator
MDKIKIILVDDHHLFREGIKSLLSGYDDFEIIGEAADGKELFSKLESLQPDIIIMDISLHGMSGIEITKKIYMDLPEIKVLILTMYNNEEFIFNSLKAGARGFLPKTTSRSEMLEAIHAINSGEVFIGQAINKIMLKSYVKRTTDEEKQKDKSSEHLSAREMEILKLYMDGLINKEISDKLEISIRTVETHKNHIMKKLGLRSTVELVKYAIKNNIAEI